MRGFWQCVALSGLLLISVGCSPVDEWNPLRSVYDRLDTQETRIAQLETSVAATQAVSETVLDSMPRSEPTTVGTESTPLPSETEKMRALLSVEVNSIEFIPADTEKWRFSPELRFLLIYRNQGNVGIRAFTGVVVFSDLFDRPQKEVRLTYDQTIPPGETVTDADKRLELNEFMNSDQWLMTTEFENMKISFEPESIIFSDGTQLGSAK